MATMHKPTAEVGIRWRRGNYVARIDGTDPKYGLRREFEQAVSAVKSGGGWLNYQLADGWYETREAGERRYLAVADGRADEVPGLAEWIAEASAGPLPLTPGAWGYEVSACGDELTGFDPRGFPYCADCAPADDDGAPLVRDTTGLIGRGTR